MANAAVRAIISAPYADTAIPLYLNSLTGMRYRTLNCMECGQEFLERNNDTMYRINDDTLPSEIKVTGASVKAKCGNCNQWYGVQVSIDVTFQRDSIPLYLQPQSVYIVSNESKRLRYLYCLECGHAFQTISDRISQVVDNRIPFEFLDNSRVGPIESLCHFPNCGQTWALML